jgi:hypothetical protein
MPPASFYAAALAALRFVEHRAPTGRRFGDDADARWRAFQGHLTTADRIDLLLRDADVDFPGAFGARTTYALRALSEDEPFGADWSSLDTNDAENLWRSVIRDAAPPTDLSAALTAIARAWELSLTPVALPVITPTTRLLVVGPSAIAAVAQAFTSTRDVAWSDQVVCVATPPAHRQIAANVPALLPSRKATVLYSGATLPSPTRVDILIESPDADPADAAAARSAAHTS